MLQMGSFTIAKREKAMFDAAALATTARSPAQDYQRALEKGQWSKFANWLTGKGNHLLSLEDYLGCRRLTQWWDAGAQIVAIDAIRGSVGRSRDFDGAFMPLQGHTSSRWISVDRAYHQSLALPLVDLWKVGDIYFVADGHHRISVASLHQQAYIDAHVIDAEFEDQC